MVIQTNIKALDEHGKEGCIAVKSPKELLQVMQCEGVKECEITISSMGSELVESKSITLDDAKKWAEMG